MITVVCSVAAVVCVRTVHWSAPNVRAIAANVAMSVRAAAPAVTVPPSAITAIQLAPTAIRSAVPALPAPAVPKSAPNVRSIAPSVLRSAPSAAPVKVARSSAVLVVCAKTVFRYAPTAEGGHGAVEVDAVFERNLRHGFCIQAGIHGKLTVAADEVFGQLRVLCDFVIGGGRTEGDGQTAGGEVRTELVHIAKMLFSGTEGDLFHFRRVFSDEMISPQVVHPHHQYDFGGVVDVYVFFQPLGAETGTVPGYTAVVDANLSFREAGIVISENFGDEFAVCGDAVANKADTGIFSKLSVHRIPSFPADLSGN